MLDCGPNTFIKIEYPIMINNIAKIKMITMDCNIYIYDIYDRL